MSNSCYRTLLVATFTFLPCVSLLAQDAVIVSGVHAKEEFCKNLIKQVDLGAAYLKANAGGAPDPQRQTTYITEQKAMGALMVKTAPASLGVDVANFMKIANTFYDTQLPGRQGDREAMIAAGRAVASPEHFAAAKRMNEYCGINKSAS